MNIWSIIAVILQLNYFCRAEPFHCQSPEAPDNGEVTCLSGTAHFDMCAIKCQPGYEIDGPSRVMCWCRTQDDCSWKGGDTSCKAAACDMPSFDNGRVTLLDKWPDGFAGIVEFTSVPPALNLERGWSIVVVFDRQLGQDVSIDSWTMDFSKASFHGQTFTFINAQHNEDLTESRRNSPNLKFMFVVNNLMGSIPEAAYVGLHDYRRYDASCIKAPIMHPIVEFSTSISPPTSAPTTTPKQTTPEKKVKKKPKRKQKRVKAKNPKRTKPKATESPITESVASSTKKVTRPPLSKIRNKLKETTTLNMIQTEPTTPATMSTTTTASTTTTTTTTTTATIPTTPSGKLNIVVPTPFAATTTVPPKLEVYCKLQRGEDAFTSEEGWVDRGVQSFNANAMVETDILLKDWAVVISFDSPIANIQVWSAEVLESSADGLYWSLGPLNWDEGLPPGQFSMSFIARNVKIRTGKVSGKVFLCSDSFETGDALMMRPQRRRSTPPSSRKRRSLEVHSRVARQVNSMAKTSRCTSGFRNGIPTRAAEQTVLDFSPNKDGTKYNYNELLHMSILFFEAQRSGKLPPEQRVSWRGDSAMKDGCDAKVDVPGGWYGAGNFVKYNFPMAFSLTTLAWGAIAFGDAYQTAGEMRNMINMIKWPTEYLIKCHISKYQFVAQVGDSKFDDSFWGRPEQMNVRRPTYKITSNKPGSELAGEAAAALAASSIVLKKSDPALSARALKHAKELYEFATTYRGDYHKAVPAAAPQYQSYSGYEDELVWSAVWLHKATNDIKYLRDATTLYAKIGGMWSVEDRYVWDRKLVGAQVLLADITGNDLYMNPLGTFLDNLETAPVNSKGMYHLDEWGPNRYTAGSAFIALVSGTLKSHMPREAAYLRWAEKQMGMILGDTGRSFVVGFGKSYPKKIRHSSSSCPPFPTKCDWSTYGASKPNHYILYGAMVGGPDETGTFEDDRENIKGNHVACDYNAVFQSAIAGLKHFAMKGVRTKFTGSTVSAFTKPTKPTFPTTPNTMQTRISPMVATTPSQYVTPAPRKTRPAITNKVRCARSSPVGTPIRSAGQIVPSFKANNDGTKHNYNEALHLSLLFFEIQRAGRLPPNNRVPWRGDSTLKDGCDVGADVSGGWFDAGDHVKFGFPMAFSLTTLAWGGIAFKDAYVDSGEIQNMIETVRWGADFFVNAHTAKYELIGQVGNGKADHDSWGRPETMSMRRPAYKITAKKPGTELAAEAAAALAASSIFLKESDPAFSAEALRHAEELYEFADKYRGMYHLSIRDAKKYYQSFSGYDDELIWGAAWLYKATKNRKYLNKASQHYSRIQGKYVVETRYSWDRKLCGAQAILGELTGDADYKEPFFKMIDGLMRARTTPQGMHFIEKWGSNRYAAGAAFMAAIAAKMNAPRKFAYQRWSTKQIDLLLGDSGRSYVVGYGKSYPKRPHHRSSSCPPYPQRCDWSNFKSSAPNYYILYGALVGGPDERGNYLDKRDLYEQTEVTTDYNACFQSAVAGVKHFAMKNRGSRKATAKPTRSPAQTQPIKRTPRTTRIPSTRFVRGTRKTVTSKKPTPCRPPSSWRCRQRATRKPAVTTKTPCRPPNSWRCRQRTTRKPATAITPCRPPNSWRCRQQRANRKPTVPTKPACTPPNSWKCRQRTAVSPTKAPCKPPNSLRCRRITGKLAATSKPPCTPPSSWRCRQAERVKTTQKPRTTPVTVPNGLRITNYTTEYGYSHMATASFTQSNSSESDSVQTTSKTQTI